MHEQIFFSNCYWIMDIEFQCSCFAFYSHFFFQSKTGAVEDGCDYLGKFLLQCQEGDALGHTVLSCPGCSSQKGNCTAFPINIHLKTAPNIPLQPSRKVNVQLLLKRYT